MRKMTRTLLASTAVIGVMALPAAGAVAGDNEVTFTVAENTLGLSIDHANTAVDLTESGNALFSLTGQSKSGTLPVTTVTDARGLLQGWTVGVKTDGDWTSENLDTVAASNGRVFIDATDATTFAATLTTNGLLTGMTVTGGAFTDTGTESLSTTAYTLLSGTTSSITTAEITYTPAIKVTIPGGTAPGTYSAIVTQSAT